MHLKIQIDNYGMGMQVFTNLLEQGQRTRVRWINKTAPVGMERNQSRKRPVWGEDASRDKYHGGARFRMPTLCRLLNDLLPSFASVQDNSSGCTPKTYPISLAVSASGIGIWQSLGQGTS
jgi:hypothetical protein